MREPDIAGRGGEHRGIGSNTDRLGEIGRVSQHEQLVLAHKPMSCIVATLSVSFYTLGCRFTSARNWTLHNAAS